MRIPAEVLPLYPTEGNKPENMRADAIAAPSRAASALSEQAARKRVAREREAPRDDGDARAQNEQQRQNRGQPGEPARPYERRKAKQAVMIDTRQGSLIDTKA